jgi:hypothetical protein
MIYEPLKTNHCLFAKLLVLKWRYIRPYKLRTWRVHYSQTNSSNKLSSISYIVFMVTDSIIFTFSSYKYITRSSSCEVHTLFLSFISLHGTTLRRRVLQICTKGRPPMAHNMFQFSSGCECSPSYSGHFNCLNRLALVGPQYQTGCGGGGGGGAFSPAN